MTTGGPARIQLSRRPGWRLPGTGRARQAPGPITQAAGAPAGPSPRVLSAANRAGPATYWWARLFHCRQFPAGSSQVVTVGDHLQLRAVPPSASAPAKSSRGERGCPVSAHPRSPLCPSGPNAELGSPAPVQSPFWGITVNGLAASSRSIRCLRRSSWTSRTAAAHAVASLISGHRSTGAAPPSASARVSSTLASRRPSLMIPASLCPSCLSCSSVKCPSSHALSCCSFTGPE